MIAIWTPALSDVNGQNLVTRQVVSKLSHAERDLVEYPSGSGGKETLGALFAGVKLAYRIIRHRHRTLYLVCSRSHVGFLRDIPALMFSRLGRRVIIHVHGSDFPSLFTRLLLGRVARWLYRFCEVVVPSNHLIDLLADVRFKDLVVCENFAVATEPTSKDVTNNQPFTVLWNSNVLSSKGFVDLAEALRQLTSEGHKLRFVVLGNPIGDAERDIIYMTKFLNELNAESWVQVVGVVPYEKVQGFIDLADVVALPSTYSSECQPLSIVQAMMSARHVLLADTDALRATAGTYPAVFVERNSKAIAEGVLDLLKTPNAGSPELDGPARTAKARFSMQRFDTQIANILSGTSNTEFEERL